VVTKGTTAQWSGAAETLKKLLDAVDGILDDFLGISKFPFCFARNLFVNALGFLFLASNQFPGFLLNFASEVFSGTFDLIFVHDGFP